MQYSVACFNQEKITAIEYYEGKKVVKVNSDDIFLLNWIINLGFCNHVKYKNFDGINYIWCSIPKILEDLPILNCSERTVSRMFKKLKDIGLIKTKQICLGKNKGSNLYVAITELLISCLNEYTIKKTKTVSHVTNKDDKNVRSNNILFINNYNNIISKDIISQNSSNFLLKEDDLGDDNMTTLFSGIVDTKKEKEKSKEKKKEKRTYISTIENYTDNPKLREWLLKFVDKQNKYFMIEKNHPFSIVSLDAMLEKLDGNKTDEDKIDVILSCLENDYHGVYVKSDKKYYKKQSTLSRIESEEIHSNSFDEEDRIRQEKFKEEMSRLGKQTTF